MSEYRLDKTAFKKQTVREADHQLEYWKKQDPQERLRAATYLILSAYGLLEEGFPPMDKNSFTWRKRKN